jgi:hypothetical protein
MDGLALGARLPDRWSKTTNVKWAIDVPGRGWSSPVVAGNTVFVTSAISSRPFKQPTPGHLRQRLHRGDARAGPPDGRDQQAPPGA